MRVAVLGAGFAGLSCGYYLARKGHQVTILEKEDRPGGLAAGFKKTGWSWPLEWHYHHLFQSDSQMVNFAKEIGIEINFFKAKTSILTSKGISRLDSAGTLLSFPDLDFASKVRTGITLGYLKLTPSWKPLEKITAESFIIKTMGEKSWQLLWEPLFRGKFGQDAKNVPASWFWARIKKRSAYLGYPEGGFDTLARSAADAIIRLQGKINYKSKIVALTKVKDKFRVAYKTNGEQRIEIYDRVVATFPFLSKPKLKSLGAITLVMRLNKPFLPNDIYWLNIGLNNFPFLGVIEHTHLIPKKYYQDEHLVYVGKYLAPGHKYFSLSKKELLSQYDQYLNVLKPGYRKSLIGFDVFKAPFAQPIIPLNYSGSIPPVVTDTPGLYRATIEQVYPWDRGTNYAVELGKKVADLIDADE